MRKFHDDEKPILLDALLGENGHEYLSFAQVSAGEQLLRMTRFAAMRSDRDAGFGRLPIFAALAADAETALKILAMVPEGHGLDLGYGGGDSANEVLIVNVLIAAGDDLIVPFLAGMDPDDTDKPHQKFLNAGVREVTQGFLASRV